jgi:16S rRNA (guanine966-N2)-methyltransferase
MIRIAGGTFKGRVLKSPGGAATRPSSARTRAAIFDILAHGIDGFSFDGARVLDLFAGTGALGFEALSRGAEYCLFVEHLGPARAQIRENADKLEVTGRIRVLRRDAAKLGLSREAAPFDLLLADPPYDQGLGERALAGALAGGWLAKHAVCVLEERASTEIDLPAGFDLIDRRRHGEAQTVIVRVSPAA